MAQLKAPLSAGWIGWFPLAALAAGALSLYHRLEPWAFMWILAISIYLGVKWLSLWKARNRTPHTLWRSIAYLLAWPGMDAESFLDTNKVVLRPRSRAWFWAIFQTGVGAVLFWSVARRLPEEQPLLRGWTGMLGLILLLHFGSFQVLALVWESFGVDAVPIMSSPLGSKSLSKFWGQRWNLGFRQLSHELIFGPLHRTLGVGLAGFLAFAVSGLIHDLVISVPARGGYGLPTTYFVIQGLGVGVERSSIGKKVGLRQGIRGWLYMAIFTAAPVFWLFHPPFVLRVIVPFMKAVHAL